jgi:hypothetical protein
MAETVKPVKQRERTISFYEIVARGKTGTSRMTHARWSKHLAALEGTPLGERVFEANNRTLIGEVISHNGEMHLKLMRVRDENSWIGIYRPDVQSVDDLDVGNSALLETSISCAFCPMETSSA